MAALPKSLINSLEGKISHAVKKKIGINFHLSKAIIFGATEHGGLELISPVDAYYVEIIANAVRFVNSSALLTREVSRHSLRQAANNLPCDDLWKDIDNTLRSLKWKLQISNDEWSLVEKQSGKMIANVRDEVLSYRRSLRTISLLGNEASDGCIIHYSQKGNGLKVFGTFCKKYLIEWVDCCE